MSSFSALLPAAAATFRRLEVCNECMRKINSTSLATFSYLLSNFNIHYVPTYTVLNEAQVTRQQKFAENVSFSAVA